MSVSYTTILKQIEDEIRSTIRGLEAEKRRLESWLQTPTVRQLYLAIWEDRLSLIAESELPEDLCWQDYERIVLATCQQAIHDLEQGKEEVLNAQLAEVEKRLKAWRFAHSLVAAHAESSQPSNE